MVMNKIKQGGGLKRKIKIKSRKGVYKDIQKYRLKLKRSKNRNGVKPSNQNRIK
jgi:hypothetical protein